MISSSTILLPLAGGLLIGAAVAMLLVFDGRVAGISGIVAGAMRPASGDWAWRALFLAGLLAGGAVACALDSNAVGRIATPLPVLAVAGVLVGFGTRLGGGCTSGHGVCGMSRGSVPSVVATLVFMGVAGLVVLVVRHGLAGHGLGG